jgi:hypothetical protein
MIMAAVESNCIFLLLLSQLKSSCGEHLLGIIIIINWYGEFS